MRSLVLLFVISLSSTASAQQLKEITNSIGMKLVLIHAGSFTMGSLEEDGLGKFRETRHQVEISNWYYLGTHEVTQYEYEKVMNSKPSYFEGAKNPVERVSWDDANSFCEKLSELPEEKAVGREYRLPTEAEWEYACRAGSTTAYCFGDSAESLSEFAWFGDRGKKTHPVGEKKANRWGLYDMHGNVWEWCQDWADDYSLNAATDPYGPSVGSLRVNRGGSWMIHGGYCRSTDRNGYVPSNRNSALGFRVALSVPTKKPAAASSK